MSISSHIAGKVNECKENGAESRSNANKFNHVIIKKISFKSFGGQNRLFVDHIAILTADLRHLSEMLPTFCRKKTMASFPVEGTMEQSVEITEGAPRLLFLQPIAEQIFAHLRIQANAADALSLKAGNNLIQSPLL